MENPSDSTAQAIIKAALECLEKYGLDGMTIRKIATQAKVNVAAINYHFGTREKLLEQVFDLATANAFSDLDEFINQLSSQPLEQQLQEFLLHYATGLAEYPNVSKVLIHDLMFSKQGKTIVAQRLETFLQNLNVRFAQLQQAKVTDFEIRFKTMQVMSVFICLGMIPNVFNQALQISIQTTNERKQLIKEILKPH